jgi:hypothetical protein
MTGQVLAVGDPLWVTLGVAVIAAMAAIGGAAWPTLQRRRLAKRFIGVIARELAEIGPHCTDKHCEWCKKLPPETRECGAPDEEHTDDDRSPKQWWEYLTKRFVHEEFLARDHIGEHRDFVLSLDPELVYQLSQLWIAFAKRDRCQWKHFLGKLSENKNVTSDGLTTAAEHWKVVIDRSPKSTAEWARSPGSHTAVEQVAGLFDARSAAYAELMEMLAPILTATEQERRELGDDESGQMMAWYDRHGLLLSGNSVFQFRQLRRLLKGELPETTEPHSPEGVTGLLKDAKSALRTELKIDLGVRHPDERDQPSDTIHVVG